MDVEECRREDSDEEAIHAKEKRGEMSMLMLMRMAYCIRLYPQGSLH
jgi:hypothetical protein